MYNMYTQPEEPVYDVMSESPNRTKIKFRHRYLELDCRHTNNSFEYKQLSELLTVGAEVVGLTSLVTVTGVACMCLTWTLKWMNRQRK